ncbi:hypothetical protein TYRP_020920 [Tyrophagus putrescentiae]|nr:hypothetical protein TYRP_020920 [Tyrophagus putrescentiae]
MKISVHHHHHQLNLYTLIIFFFITLITTNNLSTLAENTKTSGESDENTSAISNKLPKNGKGGGGGGGGGGNVGPFLKRLVIAPFRFGIKAVRRGGDVHNDLVDFVTNGTYQSKVPGVINYVLGNETDWRSAEGGQKTSVQETTAAPLAKGKAGSLAAKLFPLRKRKKIAEKSTPKEKVKATGGKKEGVMDTLIDMTF